MLKNNGAALDNKNSASPYLNWFVKDVQDLKRGGTAPIMNSRKNKINQPIDSTNAEPDLLEIPDTDNMRTTPVVISSYGAAKPFTAAKIGTNPTNEGHKISRIVNNAGVTTYKLSRKQNNDGGDGRLAGAAPLLEFFAPNFASPSHKVERRIYSGASKAEEASNDFGDNSLNNLLFPRNSQNIVSNRPQTAHFKANGAFRKGRILNESSQNYEEFPTPNTGNLDLESLSNINNKSSDRKPSPLREQQVPKANELRNSYDVKGGFQGRPQAKQESQFESETGKPGRTKTAEVKYSKAKQVLEGRRYAEDVQNLDIRDADDEFESNVLSNRITNPQGRSNEKPKDDNRENLISMIGRNRPETTNYQRKNKDFFPKKEEAEGEPFAFGNFQRFSLEQEEDSPEKNYSSQKAQRPPARKNWQAMNLDEPSGGTQQSEKRMILTAPITADQIEQVRPPSRHKLPNKALGLDLPTDSIRPGGQAARGPEKDIFSTKKDPMSRKANHEEPEFVFNGDDFENLGFDNVLDFSDFLDEEEAKPKSKLVRPTTSIPNQRSNLQSSQATKSKGEGVKQGRFQSAKPKPADNQFSGFNNLFSNKGEPFDKLVNAKPQKEPRVEEYSSNNRNNTSKGQTKNRNDVDACDILNVDSGSENSEEAVPVRRNAPQSANVMFRGQSGSKPWEPEKVNKNNFVSSKGAAYKDKKSQIVFIYNKESKPSKKDNIDLPFETTLEKDFVGLFAN